MRLFISNTWICDSFFGIGLAESQESSSELIVLGDLHDQPIVVFSCLVEKSSQSGLQFKLERSIWFYPFYKYSEDVFDSASDISFFMLIFFAFDQSLSVFSLSLFLHRLAFRVVTKLFLFNFNISFFILSFIDAREGIDNPDDFTVNEQFWYFNHFVVFEDGRVAGKWDVRVSGFRCSLFNIDSTLVQ